MNDDDDEDDDDDHHHHDGNLYSAMPPLFTLRMLTALREINKNNNNNGYFKAANIN